MIECPPVKAFESFDTSRVPSPCYVVDMRALGENLRLLGEVSRDGGVRTLMALKAFSCFAVADCVSGHLQGTAASGLYEARLGKSRFHGEVHAYVPGLKSGQVAEILDYADVLILNSLEQWRRLRGELRGVGRERLGLRINPNYSQVSNPLYDPCAPCSRLGVPVETLGVDDVREFSGLHVHALCEQGYESFDRLLAVVEEKAASLLPAVDWINLGGGVLITEAGFDVGRFVERLADFCRRTGLRVYLEPGAAVVWEAGGLVGEVLDCSRRGDSYAAILDCSATCHLPEVVEAGYVPGIREALAADGGEGCLVHLGGPTCLAGDRFGAYRFAEPPRAGDRLLILDAAYYSMVRSTTFNGTPLPAIALWYPEEDRVDLVREFSYDDFERRCG